MDDYLKGAPFSLGRFRVACGDKLLEVVLEYRKDQLLQTIYRNIPNLSPGAYIFQRPFFGGAYIRREISLSKSARLILGEKCAS